MLDLARAWRRVQANLEWRAELPRTAEYRVAAEAEPAWLEALGVALGLGEYRPGPVYPVAVRERGGAVRPIAYLAVADQVVYYACVGACVPAIARALAWADEAVDLAHDLAAAGDEPGWLTRFLDRPRFEARTAALARAHGPWVGTSDVARFYQHVDLEQLLHDLRRIGAPAGAVDQLAACLRGWAVAPGRGLPQGHAASDILGKLYLDPVDRALRAGGHAHCRYVDDYRVFGRDRRAVRRGLADLASELGARGLALNARKTRLYHGDRAAARRELRHAAAAVVRRRAPALARVVLRLGLRALLTRPGQRRWWYLSAVLVNLERLGDRGAARHARRLLACYPAPKLTRRILDHFGAVGAVPEVARVLVRMVEDPAAAGPYQRYQVLAWLAEAWPPASSVLLGVARRLARDGGAPWFLRTLAWQLVGDLGGPGDRRRLAAIAERRHDVVTAAALGAALATLDRRAAAPPPGIAEGSASRASAAAARRRAEARSPDGGRALPAQWLEALAALEEVSRECAVPYAVVGSLGVALAAGLPWTPHRPGRGGGAAAERDLDVFVLGDAAARARFAAALAAVRPRGAVPRIDPVPLYHAHVQFEAGTAWLRYRNLAEPVEAGVFEPVRVTAAAARPVPVLHPLTHFHLLWLNPLPAHLGAYLRVLWTAPRGAAGRWTEARFRPFHRMRRRKVEEFPVRVRASRVRGWLYDWELRDPGAAVIALKRAARERCPALARWGRRLLD